MTNRIALATIVLLVVAPNAGAQDSATAKPKTAALAGMIHDQFGHPVKDATLAVDGTELKAFTNDSGMFFLGGIPAGKNDFSVTHLGYAPVHFQVALSADTTLMVNIPLKNVQMLPGVGVAAAGTKVSANLIRNGYYERKNVGIGSFIGPEKVDSMSYAGTPSVFLRDVRGVTVRCRAAGRCVVTPTRGGCMATFVNKSLVYGQLDDAVSPGEVYAIEVYERSNLVPVEFSLPRRLASCGVIAIWTKSFANQ